MWIYLRYFTYKIALFSIAITVIIHAVYSPHKLLATEPSSSVFEYQGVIVPAKEAAVAPFFDGWLKKIHFLPGQHVKKGELLFEFSPVERNLLLGIDRARLKSAEAQFSKAQSEYDRKKKLRKKNVSSEADVLEAQAAKVIAESNFDIAKQNVKMSELILANLKLYAPFAGLISQATVREGTYLTKTARGDGEMAVVKQLDPIRVIGYVPYNVYAQRRKIFKTDNEMIEGLQLELTLPDGTLFEHQGRLVSGGYLFEEKSQKLKVWVDFPNPDLLLRPGLKVKIKSLIKD